MDLYDLAVKDGLMTQAEADAARAKAAAGGSTGASKTPATTSTKYPAVSSSTDATAIINRVFKTSLNRVATAAELKYWKPLLASAQKANAATQSYKVSGTTGIQSSTTGLNEDVWLADKLATDTAYKKALPAIDYAKEINTFKTEDPALFTRLQDKAIYDKLIKVAGSDAAKIQEANDTTTYGRGLKDLAAAIQAKATDSGASNTPEELTALAKKLYDKGLSLNTNEGLAAVDAVLKTKDGLIKNQSSDIVKIASDKKIYDNLIAAAGNDFTKIKAAKETTAYGRGLANIEAALQAKVLESGASNSFEEITALAQSLYDKGIDPQSAMGASQIEGALKYGLDATTGKYKGTAATTVADLQNTAAANGLDLQKNFGDKVAGWISAINSGEQVDNIKQQIRDVAKLGQPDSVKKLIDNGIDLKTVYAPYRNTMASTLEIQDPNSIDLNDPTLRMAITPNGEMNLYDYQKTLRKDTRWQYTQQANGEVADATKKILQDFGFMG